jgi:hypothetical protein
MVTQDEPLSVDGRPAFIEYGTIQFGRGRATHWALQIRTWGHHNTGELLRSAKPACGTPSALAQLKQDSPPGITVGRFEEEYEHLNQHRFRTSPYFFKGGGGVVGAIDVWNSLAEQAMEMAVEKYVHPRPGTTANSVTCRKCGPGFVTYRAPSGALLDMIKHSCRTNVADSTFLRVGTAWLHQKDQPLTDANHRAHVWRSLL